MNWIDLTRLAVRKSLLRPFSLPNLSKGLRGVIKGGEVTFPDAQTLWSVVQSFSRVGGSALTAVNFLFPAQHFCSKLSFCVQCGDCSYQHCIIHLKCAKRVDLKCSQCTLTDTHTHTQGDNVRWWVWQLTRLWLSHFTKHTYIKSSRWTLKILQFYLSIIP